MATVTKRIIEYNKKRNPYFLQIKYKALTESPFRFFRGTCHLFYEDLVKKNTAKDPTKTWICGDLHLENFGTYKGNNGLVYFDLNDFDEAILAPATWEVMRALTSIYLATATLQKQRNIADKLAACFINTYLKNILSGKPLAFERATAKGLIKTFITTVSKRKAQNLLEGRLLFKGTEASLKIIKDKTVAIKDSLKKPILSSVKTWCKKNKYTNWKTCDAAYRIAGTGSLGITRFIILMYDKTGCKHFLLDMKEALPSSLKPFIKVKQPVWESEADRVITIQSYAQNVIPALLSTINHNKTSYVIKRLQPTADIMSLDLCKGKIKKLEEIISAFAEISASAHLRSTGRDGSSTTDDLITFFQSTTVSLKKSLLNYSKKYALKVKEDYDAYCKGFKQ
jgi:uncharacterized protein (DUF2252 family)